MYIITTRRITSGDELKQRKGEGGLALPEEGLDRLLGKLKDTRVAGKQLKLRRYRED